MKKAIKKAKIKLTEEQKKAKIEEQKKKRKDAAFRRKIRNIFVNAGFKYLSTMDKHVKIGKRIVEVDAVFFYENILLICEDTGASAKDKGHIRKKKEAFDEIHDNFSDYFRWLCNTFPEQKDNLKKYREDKYLVFNFYISQSELDITDDERELYSNIKFIEPQTLNYFQRISQTIRLSSRYEIFRFLNIKKDQIGLTTSESTNKKIKAPIIYPQDSTGLRNGVRIVSFMMSAETLLSTSYVMRKDNWEESMYLYQRLIQKEKIKKIRDFLAKKSEAFYNNIIVGLPDNVQFLDVSGAYKTIDQITDFERCAIEFPDEMNSICVIDGQHRIFAHYEGYENDKNEKHIAQLRKQLHLLVTGLIFPENMPALERTKIQSEIFLDINSNSKPVPADVLLHIEMIKNPFSDIGLARRVIEKLNGRKIFLNKFELSTLDESKIKVASIVKFALRYLVTITPTEGKVSFYTYWDGSKTDLENKSENALKEYIDFCAKQLEMYFSAVKSNFKTEWNNPNSKLLSVISLNGFIIALNRQLKSDGIQEFNFFIEKFKSLAINFSKEVFPYTSSQYRKFSDQIIQEAFDLDVSEY